MLQRNFKNKKGELKIGPFEEIGLFVTRKAAYNFESVLRALLPDWNRAIFLLINGITIIINNCGWKRGEWVSKRALRDVLPDSPRA